MAPNLALRSNVLFLALFEISPLSFNWNSCYIHFDVSQCIFNCFYYSKLLQIQEKGIWIVHYLVAELRELMLQCCIALKIVCCKWSRFNSALNSVVILKHYCQSSFFNVWQNLSYFTLVWLCCGRTVGRSVYGHVITKFSRMGRLLHFLNHGAAMARFAREGSAINFRLSFNLSFLFILHDIPFTFAPFYRCTSF